MTAAMILNSLRTCLLNAKKQPVQSFDTNHVNELDSLIVLYNNVCYYTIIIYVVKVHASIGYIICEHGTCLSMSFGMVGK